MSPEISILMPCVLDNIRLAASSGNASVASLPQALPSVTASHASLAKLGGRAPTFISNSMRLRVEVLTSEF
jgi:hypothetical protein